MGYLIRKKPGTAPSVRRAIPTISQFYGILVRIFYNDHAPPPFHAVYGEHELVVGISPVSIIGGGAPARVRSMVLEWTPLHQLEPVQNWRRCQEGQAPSQIAPLD